MTGGISHIPSSSCIQSIHFSSSLSPCSLQITLLNLFFIWIPSISYWTHFNYPSHQCKWELSYQNTKILEHYIVFLTSLGRIESWTVKLLIVEPYRTVLLVNFYSYTSYFISLNFFWVCCKCHKHWKCFLCTFISQKKVQVISQITAFSLYCIFRKFHNFYRNGVCTLLPRSIHFQPYELSKIANESLQLANWRVVNIN